MKELETALRARQRGHARERRMASMVVATIVSVALLVALLLWLT